MPLVANCVRKACSLTVMQSSTLATNVSSTNGIEFDEFADLDLLALALVVASVASVLFVVVVGNSRIQPTPSRLLVAESSKSNLLPKWQMMQIDATAKNDTNDDTRPSGLS